MSKTDVISALGEFTVQWGWEDRCLRKKLNSYIYTYNLVRQKCLRCLKNNRLSREAILRR